MAKAVRADVGQEAALVVAKLGPALRNAQTLALVVVGPNEAHTAYESQTAALAVYAGDAASADLNKVSQTAELVVWGVAPPGAENRTRAWTFILDGHVFYVLDLGEEGTFLYDIGTNEWCKWETDGYVGWNVRMGVQWGQAPGRIIGGDTFSPTAWELDPDATIDEGFRDITHVSTGGISTRSRVYLGVESVRVVGSLGDLDDDTLVTFQLRFSDDNGETWQDGVSSSNPAGFVVEMAAGDFGTEVAWRSLGSFMSPGRVFEFTDVGGLIRIDGADVFIEDFDDDAEKSSGGGGGGGQ